MKINWKVRIKNKTFWMAMIPALFVLVRAVLKLFGIDLNTAEVEPNIMEILDAAFIVLAMLGIVVDPTTEGLEDSRQAMTYVEPKKEVF